MSYRYFFGWFGGLTTYNLVWWVFEDKYEGGRANPELWAEYGLIAALLIFLGILVTSLGTHKHIPDLIAPPEKKKPNLPEEFIKDKSIFQKYLRLNFSSPNSSIAESFLIRLISNVFIIILSFIFFWLLGNIMKIIGFILYKALPQKFILSLTSIEFFLRSLALEVAETLTINRSYKFLFFCGLLASLAGGIEAAFAIIFDTYFWDLDTRQMQIRGACIYISPVIAIFLAPFFSDKFGKKNTVMSIWAFQIIFAALPFALRYIDLTYGTSLFPSNDSAYLLPILCIHVVINVAAGIIVFATLGSMVMDLVEDIQLKTGRREEGILFSARSFADKAVSGFGLTLGGILLSLISWPSGQEIRETFNGQVPKEVLADLAFWYIPICVFAFGTALLMVRGYSLKREEHEQNIANPDTKVWKG